MHCLAPNIEHNKNLNKREVRSLAKEWQALYPPKEFAAALTDEEPLNWAKDSHSLAVEYAYEAASQHSVSLKAQKNAQIVCEKQIVLAGRHPRPTYKILFQRFANLKYIFVCRLAQNVRVIWVMTLLRHFS